MENRIRPLREVPGAARLLAQAFKESWPDFFADRSAEEIERQVFAEGPELPAIYHGEEVTLYRKG